MLQQRIELPEGQLFRLRLPLAAAVRLADRNATEPRSSLKRQGALTNGLLTALCAAELPFFPINRLAGLSCFVLARKPQLERREGLIKDPSLRSG